MPATRAWVEALLAAASDGPNYTNSVAENSLIGTQAGAPPRRLYIENSATYGRLQIPTSHLIIGRQLLLRATGRVSNIVTTPGTLTLRLNDVATVQNLAVGGAMALNAAAKTNVAWWLDWLLTVRTNDLSSGITFMHQGRWMSESVVGAAAGTAGTIMLPASTPVVGTGYSDPASALTTLDLTAQFSIANAGNAIRMHQLSLVTLN
jgi:hypothetical protein